MVGNTAPSFGTMSLRAACHKTHLKWEAQKEVFLLPSSLPLALAISEFNSEPTELFCLFQLATFLLRPSLCPWTSGLQSLSLSVSFSVSGILYAYTHSDGQNSAVKSCGNTFLPAASAAAGLHLTFPIYKEKKPAFSKP